MRVVQNPLVAKAIGQRGVWAADLNARGVLTNGDV